MRPIQLVMQNKTNNKGVTLVEVMIALVVLLLVFMGLLQASLLSISHNFRNEVRDEATNIASEYMTRTRSEVFTTVISANNCVSGIWNSYPVTPSVTRVFRNNIQMQYNMWRCVTNLNNDNKTVGIRVTWTDLRTNESLSYTIFSTWRNK